MPIYFTPENRLISWYSDCTIKTHRPTISLLLIEKYGSGPHNEKEIVDALFFTLDWYQDKFMELLNNEKELTFYQGIFLLHEMSSMLHQERPNESPLQNMDRKEFAVYRRILKLILEQACDIPLVSGMKASLEYMKSKESLIDELLYLGDLIFSFSNLLTAQDMIEDCVELKFTPDNLFYFNFKHQYGHVISELDKSYNDHLAKAVTGKDSLEDFIVAIKDCMGIDYGAVIGTIEAIHNHFEAGKFALDQWNIYPINLKNLYGIPVEKGTVFLKGLTLTKDNKMSLKEAVYRPHKINKYLYRPFLIWNVDGNDMTFVGDKIFIESIHSLCTNAFGWGKYPSEWESDCFKKYIQRKVSFNDKILEDQAEKLLANNSIIYDRNIKSLRKWNNHGLNIDNEKCGEIDFMFIHENKIFIADSKHQITRYDMNNYKNDFAYFDTNKKSYNKTISRKLQYLSSRLYDIQEHFQVLTNNRALRLPLTEINGIFVVNTPTFVMHNNEFRIYTLKSFEELITGRFRDESYNIMIDEGNQFKMLQIDYPYFKKPKYRVFNYEDYEKDDLESL